MRRRSSAVAVYLVYACGSALFFAVYKTLATVYRVEIAHLDALQLVLVGTALEVAVFFFEVPTGVIADTVSRRLSVVIGMLLTGFGFALEGWIPRFGTILLAQLVWGIGSTFESGAVDAWITDEVGETRAADAFLRGAQAGQVGALVGIGGASLLGMLSLGTPLVVAGGGFVLLGVVLALSMSEEGFVREPGHGAGRNPFVPFARTLGAGLAAARQRPMLRWILVIAVFAGASSEVFDRLWQARLLLYPLPFGWSLGLPGFFGAVSAVAMVISLVATEVARRRVDAASHRAVTLALLGMTVLLALAVVGFGAAGDAETALAFYFTAVLARRVNAPLFRVYLNQNTRRRVRATVFSLSNQMDALGQIAGGPLLGLVAVRAGMPWAFAGCAAFLVPAAAIYLRSARRPPEPLAPEPGLPADEA